MCEESLLREVLDLCQIERYLVALLHHHALVVQRMRHIVQHLFDLYLIAERVFALESSDNLGKCLVEDLKLVKENAQFHLVLSLDHLAWLRLLGHADLVLLVRLGCCVRKNFGEASRPEIKRELFVLVACLTESVSV